MRRLWIALWWLIWVSVSPALAQLYRWTDNAGKIHITDNPATIPPAYRDRAPQAGTVLIGEVGLSGEVRRVSRLASRLVEARSLGFTRAIIPKGNLADVEGNGIAVEGVATIREALGKIALSE